MLSLAHFRSQRRSLRSLIYLFWIYSFVTRAVNAFSQIYIYELFDSVPTAIVASIVNFTGIMIGFSIWAPLQPGADLTQSTALRSVSSLRDWALSSCRWPTMSRRLAAP